MGNLKGLVSRPGDFVSRDSPLRIGVGPAERSSRFGISADVFACFLARSATEVKTPRLILAYSQTPSPSLGAMYEYTRREQRLQEIMDELMSMTEWKKP